ncbi:MAG: NYN domain-containing protein [candidate division WWE3 bacterium]|nr:NYN domain-containing protein [candidate division WWE3 bacterium]
MSKSASRNLVIIDGSNFYHKAKKLAPTVHLSHVDYRQLLSKVLDIGIHKMDILYCVGEVINIRGDAKSKLLFANQQALFYLLEQQKIIIKRGYLLKTGSIYHEKGVDVRMALEIQRGALTSTYDSCFLVSSDTDLLPAVEEARTIGKEVVYVGFENSLSSAMTKGCSRTRVITKVILEETPKYQKK